MGFEIKGLDDFQKHLKKIEQNLAELDGQVQEVSFDELFNPSFMKEYTKFSSIDKMFETGGFEIESAEDFDAIPQFDDYVNENTRFTTWEQMREQAVSDYLEKQLSDLFKKQTTLHAR